MHQTPGVVWVTGEFLSIIGNKTKICDFSITELCTLNILSYPCSLQRCVHLCSSEEISF